MILSALCGVTLCVAALAQEHPVYPMPAANVDAARQSGEVVMAIPDDTLRTWDPPVADIFIGACPNCDDGPNRFAVDFDWSPDDPDRMQCRYCEMWFPNDRYPLDHVTELISPAGTPQAYRYFLRDDGLRYYLDAMLLNRRRFWMRKRALELAQLYTVTGEQPYADKAAVIIRRAAEVYPEMPIRGSAPDLVEQPYFYTELKIIDTPDNGVMPVPEPEGRAAAWAWADQMPYPYRGMRTGLAQWYYSEVPLELAQAYDQIAPALDDATRAVIEGYLRATVNYCRAYPRFLSNKDPSLAQREIMLGRILGEPEFVHGGIIRVERTLEKNIYADGTWREGSPGYASASMDQAESALESARGYSDAPGYRGIETGRHFDDFDPEAVEQVDRLHRNLSKMILPNGLFTAAYDTHYASGRATELFDAPQVGESTLLWAGGHAVLGMGRGDDQVQARLQFMGRSGHFHYDQLSLQLFAEGREMASDIGYTHTRLRAYCGSTLAHNTVMVDTEGQIDEPTSFGGTVQYFDDANPDVQFISVRSDHAYEQTSLYQRSLALVRVSDDQHYLVDLFEVEGGSTHDWLLHGDADHNGAVTTDLPTSPRPGTLLPEGEAFEMWEFEDRGGRAEGHRALGLVRNIRAARTDQPWQAAITIEPDDGSQLRLHMLAQPDTQVMLAEIPSIRRVGTSNEQMLDYWMPLVIARRQGENLSSRFVAVHEPAGSEPFIRAVRQEQGAVIVETDRFTDVHLFGSLDTAGRIVGRYGFVRLQDGAVVSAHLADGTQLTYEHAAVTLPAADTGKVLSIDDRTITLSGTLDTAGIDRLYLEIPGHTVYAIPIGHVEPTGDSTTRVTLKASPAIDLHDGGGELLSFPLETFEGDVTYRLPRSGGAD